MPSAEVGALRVRLEMDTGSFIAASKEAEKSVGTLAGRLGISGATIAKAATAIGGALAATFTVEKIQSALQYADAMGKMAQSAGVSTEAFSALTFAASLSEISMEELASSAGRFNKNISEAAKGGTDAAFAFETMGIRLKNSDGQLRNFDELLGDVAERFAGYADGANKVAIAQELFGKSGARLIPLLNAGRSGIEDLKKEAKDLGVVISDVDAKKAEAFNDALTRMAASSRALAKDIGLLLAGPATAFLEWIAKVSAFGSKGAADLNKAMNTQALNDSILLARKQIESLAAQKARKMADGKGEGDPALEQVNRDLDAAIKKFDTLSSAKRRAGIGDFTTTVRQEDAPNLGEEARKAQEEANEITRLSTEAIALNQERVAMYGETLAGLVTPMETYRQKMLEIAQASQAGMVDTERLTAASVQAWASMQSSIAQTAGNLTGALSQLFAKNKGFAYANALISTYEAVTRALANPPGPPFSYVNAAAAAIKGMAQVRAIASTTPGSGSAPSAVGGDAAPTAPPPADAPSRRVLEVAGLSAGKFVRGEVMRDIVDGLLEYQRDGGEVVLR